MRRVSLALVAVLAAALLVSATTVAKPKPKPQKGSSTNTSKLRKAVTVDGILAHQRAFQQIANQNGGNRAANTPGYDASVKYVSGRLRRAGYSVKLDPFDFPRYTQNSPTVFEQKSPNARTYVEGTDFMTAEFSGAGDVEKAVVPAGNTAIPPPGGPGTSTSGCAASDYPASTAGNVSLIQRGTCTFTEKARLAKEAGAAAVVIFNDGFPGRTDPIAIGAPPFIGIPVVMSSSAIGEELYNAARAGGATVRIKTDTTTTPDTEYNVIADSKHGDPNRTIVVGAHLDSVDEGPGINDNGSGSSSNLEIAEEIAELRGAKPRHRLRFAFWGAEEAGLVGSTAYVNGLSPRQLSKISMNLNFDMVGSPNFVRFVYDGDTSDTPPPAGGAPPGSGRIEDEFNGFFRSQGLETDPTAFDGRSDYGPFIAAGIPAGGLFSGAEGIKTAEQAAVYGGTAGTPFDPCYHQACDTIANLNPTALSQFSDAAAHTSWFFANSKKPLVGEAGARKSRAAKARRAKSAKGKTTAKRRLARQAKKGHLAYR